MLSRQQDVQKQPQRVDVRRRRGLSSSNLLGCGIGRCQSCALLERQRQHLGRLPVGFEQLGDTEVEQLHVAIGTHQHVWRLEIAVNDAVGMRVRDGAEHVEEERNP
jgi:hypothetical protein